MLTAWLIVGKAERGWMVWTPEPMLKLMVGVMPMGLFAVRSGCRKEPARTGVVRALMVVVPLWVLARLRVRVPVPMLGGPPLPLMTPLKVVVALVSPVVSVALPRTTLPPVVPPPDSELIVMLKLLRS